MPRKPKTKVIEWDSVLTLLDQHISKWRIRSRDAEDAYVSYRALYCADALVDAKIDLFEKHFIASLKKEKSYE